MFRPFFRCSLAPFPLLLAALLVISLAPAGCASGSGGGGARSAGPASYGAGTSELAVRQFLDAVGEANYGRMGQLFGTDRGPAEDRLGIAEVEQRMMVLARFLRHRDYEVVREENFAQLGLDRKRWIVRLEGTREGEVTVPIITVQAESARWYVEQVVMDALTRRTGG